MDQSLDFYFTRTFKPQKKKKKIETHTLYSWDFSVLNTSMRFRLSFFSLVKHLFQIIPSAHLQEPSVPLHAYYARTWSVL
jgi:hypothetical protein